jgi:putative membrane protein
MTGNWATQDLSHAIAALNGLSAIFLAAGYVFIRRGDRRRHRRMMLSALTASAAFLVVYVIYKLNSGFAKFGGEGFVRPVYFTILALHVVGAIALVPLVPITVWRAWREKFDAHRHLARVTWPVWMYVGVSGVVVYIMAVHMFPYHG